MEDYRTACDLLKKNSFMAVVGQKDAYHLVPIAEHCRKYLRFEWLGKLYEYTCLPFGLNVGPRVFTKLMKPVLNSLREDGYFSCSNLDDNLLLGSDY